jgi:L-seryl-tRNA(Ser) seleniumtransferase
MTAEARRQLPAIDRLLQEPTVRAWLERHGRPTVVAALRQAVDEAREATVRTGAAPSLAAILERAAVHLTAATRPSLRPVINATGVIIHTNLGRAPLSAAAIAAMERVSRSYSTLEFDLATGERGSRHSHLERLLQAVTGAEAGIAVNNNAAAVLLALTALAPGREVIIARGQLVEIGGGFRIPDVLRQSGARLVEVGTTNRTYLSDYEAALTPETALILRVHASNFRIVGFTHSPSLADLAALAHRHGLPLLDDLGSGALLDTAAYGLAHEPMVQESLQAGADLVCFSGDKLLGGPQAGIIVGRRDLIERLKRHPLARAVRIDKVSLAGLEATLRHYQAGEAVQAIPVWRMIATPAEALRRRVEAWVAHLAAHGLRATVVPTQATVGGGSLPGETLPSWALALTPTDGAAQTLAARLRQADPPVVGRIERDRLLLDARTVLPEEETLLLAAVRQALGAA